MGTGEQHEPAESSVQNAHMNARKWTICISAQENAQSVALSTPMPRKGGTWGQVNYSPKRVTPAPT